MPAKYAVLLIALLTACGCSREPPPEASATTDRAVTMLQRTPSVDGARVFFVTPTDGATVSNPVSIEFGIDGMSVTKAGDPAPDSGHHHLLINTGLPDLDLPIPADDKHVHFGDGSTTTAITLPPGEHTLQMLLGDHLHIPHEPPVLSKPITIVVKE